MDKKFVYLAIFAVLINAMAVFAEDNISGTNASNETAVNLSINNTSNETLQNSTIAEIPQNITNETVSTVCEQSRCDEGCVVCSDGKCHEPQFICEEKLSIERVFPEKVKIGETQLNLLLRNTGSVGLNNISAWVSGDGISTLEVIPLETLNAGDKDYTFVKIEAAKSGVIDLVVKLYADESLKDTIVRQLAVEEEKAEINNTAPAVNITEITDELKELKERFIGAEQDYQNKKLQGYPVDIVYDKLKETNDYIKEAQFYLVEEGYKKAQLDLKIVDDNLKEIVDELKRAKKQEASLSDEVKNNMLYICSIAAAIVSVFTAWGLVKSHVNRQKLMGLQKKIIKEKKELEKEKHELEEEKHEASDGKIENAHNKTENEEVKGGR